MLRPLERVSIVIRSFDNGWYATRTNPAGPIATTISRVKRIKIAHNYRSHKRCNHGARLVPAQNPTAGFIHASQYTPASCDLSRLDIIPHRCHNTFLDQIRQIDCSECDTSLLVPIDRSVQQLAALISRSQPTMMIQCVHHNKAAQIMAIKCEPNCYHRTRNSIDSFTLSHTRNKPNHSSAHLLGLQR